jgi:uncharacterized protein (DUF1697 family)
MGDLRALAESLGWTRCQTYIQSGNLVFEAEGDPAALARTLEAALAVRFAFPIPVLVVTAVRWAEVAADRPFGGWSDPKQLSVTLLEGVPGPDKWASLAPWKDGGDEIELAGDRVWVKTPGGYGNTKFTNSFLEKKLGLRATTRNRATVDALLSMV